MGRWRVDANGQASGRAVFKRLDAIAEMGPDVSKGRFMRPRRIWTDFAGPACIESHCAGVTVAVAVTQEAAGQHNRQATTSTGVIY